MSRPSRLPRPTGQGLAEAVCGSLAALLGGASLAVALFADTMVTVSSRYGAIAACAQPPCPHPTVGIQPERTVTHTTSIAAGGISGTLEVAIAVVVLVLLAIAVGAIVHGFSHRTPWLVLLCLGTTLILGLTLLTGFTIGFVFMPADALAVAAVALALTNLAPSRSVPAEMGSSPENIQNRRRSGP